ANGTTWLAALPIDLHVPRLTCVAGQRPRPIQPHRPKPSVNSDRRRRLHGWKEAGPQPAVRPHSTQRQSRNGERLANRMGPPAHGGACVALLTSAPRESAAQPRVVRVYRRANRERSVGAGILPEVGGNVATVAEAPQSRVRLRFSGVRLPPAFPALHPVAR